MKVKHFVSAGVVMAALTGPGCGGSGGGGGAGSPISGQITMPKFTIPAGTTKTVTGDLTVNASQRIEIDGTLLIPEGVNVALITDGPLNVTGVVGAPAPVSTASAKAATVRQGSGGGGSTIVFAGSTVNLSNPGKFPNQANVDVSSNAPGDTAANITIDRAVLGHGKDSTSANDVGGPGPTLEIGTATAISAATQKGAKNARTPDNVMVLYAAAGEGGAGFSDKVGIDDGTKVTATGTAGGKGGDLNIAAKNPPVISIAVAGTGGYGGPAVILLKAPQTVPHKKGEDFVVTSGDGGAGGNLAISPSVQGGTISGAPGTPGYLTAYAQSGGPDGGDGGNVIATVGNYGAPGTGGSISGSSTQIPVGYTFHSGSGAPSNDTKIPGGKGGSITLSNKSGGAAPNPGSPPMFILGSGGDGAGTCSINNPPAGSNGGAVGTITCHGLSYFAGSKGPQGGLGGSGNGPGKGGAAGSDDSGKPVGTAGNDGSWCTPPKGATYQSTIAVPSSNISFCTLDPSSQILFGMAADTNKTNVFQVNLGSGATQTCPVGAAISDVNGGICNSNNATRGTGVVYVSSLATNSVVILNEQTGAKTGSISVPVQIGPESLAFDPTTGRLYVSVDQGVEVFDTTNNNKLLGTISTTVDAYSMALNSTTGLLYIGNYATNQLAVLDTVKMSQKNLITLSDNSGCVTVNPVTGTVYASLYNTSSVVVLSADLSQKLATIKVGPNPWGIGVDSKRNRVYVANYNYSSGTLPNGSLTEFDGSTNAVMTTVTLGQGPTGVSVDENADKIYVAEAGSNGVAVVNGN